MSEDMRFRNRIALALYARSIKMSISDTAWNLLEKNQKTFWENEAEKFIDSANDAGIALYDVDDHR